MHPLSYYILSIPFIVLGITETLKVLTKSIGQKRIAWESFFHSGGMPSGHSAFTASIATVVAYTQGIQSIEFLIAAGFAIIVMYDARGVRNAVSEHAKIINKLKKTHLDESVGHTNNQVLIGCIVGVTVSSLLLELT